MSVTIASVVVLIFVALYVVHWLRRAFRPWPAPLTSQKGVEVRGDRISHFDIVERLFHWTNFIVLGAIILSGINIFVPGLLDPIFGIFGITGTRAMIFLHTDFVWALLVLIIIHVIWDTAIARGFRNIWFFADDLKDAFKRTYNFLGLTNDYPRDAKYDLFMKTYHWALAFSLVIQGVTGVYFMNPYGLIPTLQYGTENLFRLLHDIFAFLLVGFIIGHIYFALLPANSQILKAMVTGTSSKQFFLARYDASKWRVPQLEVVTSKPQIGG